jgi:hypothetical protein
MLGLFNTSPLVSALYMWNPGYYQHNWTLYAAVTCLALPYVWTLFMAVCWYKEDGDSWGFTFANFFLFVTNTLQY